MLTMRTLALPLIACLFWAHAYAADPYGYTWKPLRIGAGGWVTGIDMSPDGSVIVVRTDTYGAYSWSGTEWKQLVTTASMPADDRRADRNSGVYEIRIAPSHPDRFYMMYLGFVYRSDDRGATWIRTNMPRATDGANDSFRYYGEKMAIDPSNPDVVYAGTPAEGVWMTANAGATWTKVADIPNAAASGGHCGIQFDPASGTTSGKTNTLYVPSWGNGIWKSTNAGATWTKIAGGGSTPSKVKHTDMSRTGEYYVASEDSPRGATSPTLWKYHNNTWTNMDPWPGQYWHTIVVDPLNDHRVFAANDGGDMSQSWDRGATWSDFNYGKTKVAKDIPWLTYDGSGYFAVGDMMFDKKVPNKIWQTMGIGVLTATIPEVMLWNTPVTFTSQSVGIEQLVANEILAPPGGKAILGSWDRPLFYVDNPDIFPSRYGPNNAAVINMGWSIDYASSDPTFIVALADWWGVNQDAYSADGGRNWTVFPTFPAWSPSNWPIGGSIAAATPDNIVWVPANNKPPYYTKNRGTTWTKISIAGIPDNTEGWQWAYYLNRRMIAADRVTIGTFYLYHWTNGLFRSVDGGVNWTRVFTGEIAPGSGFNAQLKTVPGKAGHLFFTSGPQGGGYNDVNPDPNAVFKHSTDGGVTWQTLPSVREVYNFGFGKAAPGSDYPTIFVAGWVNNVWGIWRSDNEGQSWTQIAERPLGSLDHIKAVEGDKNVYGKVYVGFSGSGYAYGVITDPGDTAPPLPRGLRISRSPVTSQ